MFSSNLEALKIQKFPSPLAPTMVGPAGDTELSKSLHIFFVNRFLILNWNPEEVPSKGILCRRKKFVVTITGGWSW